MSSNFRLLFDHLLSLSALESMLGLYDSQQSVARAYESALREGILHYLYIKRGKRASSNNMHDSDIVEFSKRVDALEGALFISSSIPAERLKSIRRGAFNSVIDSVVDSTVFRSPSRSGLISESEGKRDLSVGIQEARQVGPTVRLLLGEKHEVEQTNRAAEPYEGLNIALLLQAAEYNSRAVDAEQFRRIVRGYLFQASDIGCAFSNILFRSYYTYRDTRVYVESPLSSNGVRSIVNGIEAAAKVIKRIIRNAGTHIDCIVW